MWWFLQALQDYTLLAPAGERALLQEPVDRDYSSTGEDLRPGHTTMLLQEIVQEILQVCSGQKVGLLDSNNLVAAGKESKRREGRGEGGRRR